MKKVLIVTDVHPILITQLEEFGLEVQYSPKITKPEAMAILGDFHGIVVRTQFPIDRELLSMAGKLEWIGRAGAGLDNIDLEYAEERGIACFNAPEGNRDAVAEHALGMILALANKITKADKEVREGTWDREGNRGFEISAKQIGIIGLGNTGKTLAKKLEGFDCPIWGYDKYVSGYGKGKIKEASLEELFREADILSLHIPLTPETKSLINKSFIEKFKKPIYIINTSRGEIIHTDHLIWGLKEGKILGAGLDVLENEKFPKTSSLPWFQELITINSVILSPHVAGWTVESYYKISTVLSEKIRNFYIAEGIKI